MTLCALCFHSLFKISIPEKVTGEFLKSDMHFLYALMHYAHYIPRTLRYIPRILQSAMLLVITISWNVTWVIIL